MSENQENLNPVSGAVALAPQNEVQPVPVQPRQPNNLQGLLMFAMEATRIEDAPSNSNRPPMEDDRRRFLEDALRSLTVDMAEIIQRAIDNLSDEELIDCIEPDEHLPMDVQQAFCNLLELVDDIDVANDFYKMGGFSIFPVCFSSRNSRVRTLACSILGDVCQNNPYCQQKALETGLLQVVLELVNTEHGETLVKCLYALSCASREYEPSSTAVVSAGGCEVLCRLLSSDEPVAARTKAAFLVRHLARHNAAAREKFIQLNLVKIITDLVSAGRDEATEHLLSIIVSIIESKNQTLISHCKDPELGLRGVIENHLHREAMHRDQFTEEKEYCYEILKFLDGINESVDYEVDR